MPETPSLISAGSSMSDDVELVGRQPVDVLGALVLGLDRAAHDAVPERVGLLLDVERELVDEALVRHGVDADVLLVVDGQGGHPVGREVVGLGGDEPLVGVGVVDAVGRGAVGVLHEAGEVVEDHDVGGGGRPSATVR